MLKHVAILAVAVLSAIAAAQGLVAFASPRTQAPASAAIAARPPGPSQAPAPTAASVAKGPDGHYWANAEINGRWVRFLVDTGASAVALTATDAQRLGLDVSTLAYERPVTTASGQTKAALVTLDHVSVAGARVEDVKALVVADGLSTSLLALSSPARLPRFEATPSALILRP